MKKILSLLSVISLLPPTSRSVQACGAPQIDDYYSKIESKISNLFRFLWKINSKLKFNNENIAKELTTQFSDLSLNFASLKKGQKLEKDYVYISEESFDDKNKFNISFKATYLDSKGLKKEKLINASASIDSITFSSIKNDINKFVNEKEFNGGYDEIGKQIKKDIMNLDSIKSLVDSTNNNFNVNIISWDLYDKNSNIINADRYQNKKYSYAPAKIYRIKTELNSDFNYFYEFLTNKKINYYNITNSKNLIDCFYILRSNINYENYTTFCDYFFKGETSLLFHFNNEWNLFFDMYVHLNNAPQKDYFLFKNCKFKIEVETADYNPTKKLSFSFEVLQNKNDIEYLVDEKEWSGFSALIKDDLILETKFYITGNDKAPYIRGEEGYELTII